MLELAYRNKVEMIYACILLLSLFSHSVLCNSFTAPWTVACQAPLSMGIPSQESWSGLSFPSSGYRPEPGIKPAFPKLEGGFFTAETPGKSICLYSYSCDNICN